jgi:hypothetical protein
VCYGNVLSNDGKFIRKEFKRRHLSISERLSRKEDIKPEDYKMD